MSVQLKIRSCGRSDIGLVRTENQDAWGKFPQDNDDLTTPHGVLFIVADGMGGHQGGREASQMAVRLISQVYFSQSEDSLPSRLKHAFEVANEQILQHAGRNPQLQGMGTTCTALVLQANHAFIAHVGDSRAYRINDHEVTQLTQDHSYVAEMQRQGILTDEEAKGHPQRSVLNRALGAKPKEEVDLVDGILMKCGDRFVICSDGLAKVTDDELKSIVMSKEPENACQALVDLANERGGSDNVTIQIITVTTTPEPDS